MTRILLAMLSCVAFATSFAQDDLVSKESIVEQLAGDSRERGILVKERPDPSGMSIDLRINFEFDSATLSPDSRTQLDALLGAFLDPVLEGFRFNIIGHTDAQGDENYNRDLSYRRAQSVQQYLVENGVSANRLDIDGRGEGELLYPHRPDDAGNRRVEVINAGGVKE